MTKLPLVMVAWDDAWVDGTEPVLLSEVHIAHRPKPIVTIGYLLREDEAGVSIANEHYADEDVYRGRTFIVRSLIRSLKPYQPIRTRAAKRPKEETPSAS